MPTTCPQISMQCTEQGLRLSAADLLWCQSNSCIWAWSWHVIVWLWTRFCLQLLFNFCFSARFQTIYGFGRAAGCQGCYIRKNNRQILRLGDLNPMEEAPDPATSASLHVCNQLKTSPHRIYIAVRCLYASIKNYVTRHMD